MPELNWIVGHPVWWLGVGELAVGVEEGHIFGSEALWSKTDHNTTEYGIKN